MRRIPGEGPPAAVTRVGLRARMLERRVTGAGNSDFEWMLSAPGTLVGFTGQATVKPLYGGTITDVQAFVKTAPTGASIVITLNENGSSLGTATITSGTHSATFVPASPTFSAGDEFTIDLNIGSSNAAAYLTVTVIGQKS